MPTVVSSSANPSGLFSHRAHQAYKDMTDKIDYGDRHSELEQLGRSLPTLKRQDPGKFAKFRGDDDRSAKRCNAGSHDPEDGFSSALSGSGDEACDFQRHG